MISANKNLGKDVIILPKACDIKNIDDIHAMIIAISNVDPIVILDGSGVESADFSFVQLVASAVASARPGVGTVTLRAAAPCIRQAFARAGLGGFPCLAGEV